LIDLGENGRLEIATGAVIIVEIPGWAGTIPTSEWRGLVQETIVKGNSRVETGYVNFATPEGCAAFLPHLTPRPEFTDSKVKFEFKCVEQPGASGKGLLVNPFNVDISGVIPAAQPGVPNPDPTPKEGLGAAAVAGIVIGVAIVVGVIVGVVVYTIVKKKQRVNQDVEASA
jgi:hypothetical protein